MVDPDYDIYVRRWGQQDFVLLRGEKIERWIHKPNGLCEPISIQIVKDEGDNSLTRVYHPLTGMAEDEELNHYRKEMKIRFSSKKRGFMLMEVVLGLMVFSILAVGYASALKALRRNSMAVEEQIAITKVVDSALRETLYYPTLEEGEIVADYERGIEVVTVIQPMEELYNEEGLELTQMFRVEVTARYILDGIEKEQSAVGWRYLPLYKP